MTTYAPEARPAARMGPASLARSPVSALAWASAGAAEAGLAGTAAAAAAAARAAMRWLAAISRWNTVAAWVERSQRAHPAVRG